MYSNLLINRQQRFVNHIFLEISPPADKFAVMWRKGDRGHSVKPLFTIHGVKIHGVKIHGVKKGPPYCSGGGSGRTISSM